VTWPCWSASPSSPRRCSCRSSAPSTTGPRSSSGPGSRARSTPSCCSRAVGRDASRLLASASLVVQRAIGVAARPLLVDPGQETLVEAAADARALVVVGLTERWRTQGLGPVRQALVSDARVPVVVVRRGLRPGGLAPNASLTRFTWSLRSGS